ncbi:MULTISPECIES: hypothetical protein [unclassified Pseudomonas]|uniref:hypothetical protein n=1 Tax=unclassified Pseudomonas TaxID=196821 RepID=UPI0002724104|nr:MULTISPECIES: hypothetical protein [unclassified Pseudomonas]EJL99950.1 hypothetical protein PMI19_03962 [Pseudomonas sp. GM16]EJM30050.1 hypothetical protein PMI23_04814 [Pseudomonas sp. GM24]
MQDISHLNKTATHSEGESKSLTPIATVRALCLLAVIAFLLIVVAGCAVQSSTPYPTLFVLAFAVSMLLSFYILMSLIEIKLAQKLMHLKSSLLIWAVFLGGLSVVAKIDAQVEINQMFHVDPSLLPMTLTAATFMHAVAKLQWIFFLISIVSFAMLVRYSYLRRKRMRAGGYMLCHLSNSLVFFLAGIFVTTVLASDERRGEVLYRFAHVADFSSYSPCTNVRSDEFDVLYLDSSRAKILIAPKIIASDEIEPAIYPLLKWVQIPHTFRTLMCEYGVGGRS